jgi:hypothetical protein
MKALLLFLLLSELGGIAWFWKSQADREARPASQPASEDYRFRVYTACTLVFVCFTVFLLLSHQQDRRAREELDHLQRRLAELEARGKH